MKKIKVVISINCEEYWESIEVENVASYEVLDTDGRNEMLINGALFKFCEKIISVSEVENSTRFGK